MEDTTSRITTIKSALTWAHHVLKGVADNPSREARLLLCHVLDAQPEYLIQYEDKVLTIEEAARFSQLAAERARGMPMAYLLGYQGFYDIEVAVNPNVLIPRPETELLVEKALEWASNRQHSFIVDVGTGSGIIALVLAKHLRNAHITAVDVSQTALDVAQKNGETLGVANRVRWLHGDLLQPLIQMHDFVDLIVANLPYIETEVLGQLEVSKYEPIIALNGGADGLDYFRRLFAEAPFVLRPRGAILLEIGASQSYHVSELARQTFPDAVITVDKDLGNHDRVVSVQL